MSQLSLFPENEFEVSQPFASPIGAACGGPERAPDRRTALLPDQVDSETDVESIEENMSEVLAEDRPTIGAAARTYRHSRLLRAEPQELSTGAWPACLTWAAALAYTSLSPSQLRRWQRAGALSFRRAGVHGAKIVMRAELDRLLAQIFTPITTDITEDFDFG